VEGVLCFTCAKASSLGLLHSVRCSEPCFISTGFNNWKKAVGDDGRFGKHQKSTCHKTATLALQRLQPAKSVSTLLSKQVSESQKSAQKCLRLIFSSVGYLARQGLALRGHDESEGNFAQLLKCRSASVPELRTWFMQKKKYTHHTVQDEILQLYGSAILSCILADARKSQSYAIIVDGTQDINRTEQESICIRLVAENLQPREEFMGFYTVDYTTGHMLASCIKDALVRFQLPLDKLRGQTYDGAANMSGAYNGCQAILCREQPLATYVHCSAHCSNLVALAVCSSSGMVRDSVQYVNDFGVLCNTSGNFKALFSKIASSAYEGDEELTTAPVRSIKPLCPTRWLVRVPAINATLQQYQLILRTLDEAKANCRPEVSAKASGLLDRFQAGSTLLCLNMAQVVLAPLECLNRSLQSTAMTVAGMLKAAEAVKNKLQKMRADDNFGDLLAKVEKLITEMDLNPLVLPRRRKPPTRFSGPAEEFHASSVDEHYRVEFFKLIDVAVQQLDERLLECPGLFRYCQLEATLLSGELNDDVNLYPELGDASSLQMQLHMFLSLPELKNSTNLTLDRCVQALKKMVPEMRAMFPNVESLVRLLIVNPASSATAERSFSALRRLKTYLRATCGQQRLNNLALCYVHIDIMDTLDVNKLMKDFVVSKHGRVILFGHIE